MIDMNKIGNYIKEERKKAGLTQEEFAMRSGLGLRFVRELEQGKETVRMDKVNQALAMFGKEACRRRKGNNHRRCYDIRQGSQRVNAKAQKCRRRKRNRHGDNS